MQTKKIMIGSSNRSFTFSSLCLPWQITQKACITLNVAINIWKDHYKAFSIIFINVTKPESLTQNYSFKFLPVDRGLKGKLPDESWWKWTSALNKSVSFAGNVDACKSLDFCSTSASVGLSVGKKGGRKFCSTRVLFMKFS